MDNNTGAVGIFDSGFGGLTALMAFEEFCPSADIIYFADTARVPYGTREDAELRRFARQNTELLRRRGAAGVIAACGTISSLLTPAECSAFKLPFSGIADAAAALAAEMTATGRIGVLGTDATVRNRGFLRGILALRPDAQVSYMACPKFVPLAEAGVFDPDDPRLAAAAREYVGGLMESRPDVIILGCTHYPLLTSAIARESGGVPLINAAREAVRAYCGARPIAGSGRREYIVSGDTEAFRATAGVLLKREIPEPLRLSASDIEVY